MQRKLVVTALGALGFGALAGWAVTADIYEHRLTKAKEDFDYTLGKRTADILGLQHHLDKALGIDIDDVPETNPNQMSTDEIIEEVAEDEVPEGETPEQTRSNLQSIIDNYTADPQAQQDFADMATIVEHDNAPPFVISRDTYAYDEEGDSYEKITLTYFPRDRVLLDDDESPIPDVARMVGWRNLSQFGGESQDPDVVFIRNRHMETDFEVVKEDDTPLPLHVKYGMEKEEFRANKAAGLIKFRQEDDDH